MSAGITDISRARPDRFDVGNCLPAKLGNGMMMLGSIHDNEFGKLIKQPDELGGVEAQCPYVIVPDADAHYVRAVAAGAKIVKEIADAGYGGRGYSCRDLEGHLWNFGSYDPWSE